MSPGSSPRGGPHTKILGFPQNSCVTVHPASACLSRCAPTSGRALIPQGHPGSPCSDPSPHPQLGAGLVGLPLLEPEPATPPPGPTASEPAKLLPGLSHPGLSTGSKPALRKASQHEPLRTGPVAWPRPQGQSAWLSIRACSGPAGRGYSMRTCELMSEGRTAGRSPGRRCGHFWPLEATSGSQERSARPPQTGWSTASPSPRQRAPPQKLRDPPRPLGAQSHISGASAWAEPQKALQMGFSPWAVRTDQPARRPLCASGH